MPADDLAALVEGRPGWRLDSDTGAAYEPGGEWSAVVRQVWNPDGRRLGYVWHVAHRQGGVARGTWVEHTARRAVARAERLPDGQ
jgi:hypothetical protein